MDELGTGARRQRWIRGQHVARGQVCSIASEIELSDLPVFEGYGDPVIDVVGGRDRRLRRRLVGAHRQDPRIRPQQEQHGRRCDDHGRRPGVGKEGPQRPRVEPCSHFRWRLCAAFVRTSLLRARVMMRGCPRLACSAWCAPPCASRHGWWWSAPRRRCGRRRIATSGRGGRGRFDRRRLLQACGERDLAALWERLASRPYPAYTERVDVAAHARLCPGDAERIRGAAEDAVAHRVRLLGPETVELGPRIDWLRDFRSGIAWPRGYMRDIAYVNRHDPSDVKVVWELSRLQWLMPAGQAYLLDGRRALGRGRACHPRRLDRRRTRTPRRSTGRAPWTWRCGSSAGPGSSACSTRAEPGRTRAFASASCARSTCTAISPSGISSTPTSTATTARPTPPGSRSRDSSSGRHRTPNAGSSGAGRCCARRFRGRSIPTASTSRPRPRTTGWSRSCSCCRRSTGRLAGSTCPRPIGSASSPWPASPRPTRDPTAARRSGATRTTRGRLPLGSQPLTDHRYLPAVVGAAFDVAELREASAGSRSEAFWLLGPGGRRTPARGRDAAAAARLACVSRRRRLRDAQRRRPRLHRLRARRARRPRGSRAQRLPVLRSRARRRDARDRLRLLPLHGVLRGAQPLPLDGVPQHAARRWRRS